jgi:trk system potassium uptake protein TrkH
MRNGFRRINCILHFVGGLLEILGLVLLSPLIFVVAYWGQRGDGWITATAFVVTAMISFSLGLVLRNKFKPEALDTTGSMLMCALGWLFASLIGALPFVIVLGSNYLDASFEAMSGFTTTGITVFSGLDNMPRSILFWRALTQWLGGVGILSFFLMVIFQTGGAHHIFGAESHKISSARPAPGLFHTLRILWAIYAAFTVLAAVILSIEKMPVFDAVCHALTALSTGGFSPHDSSIEFYSLTNHPHYRLIEYTIIFLMMLGGINFLVHYRVLTRDYKALWDNTEIRYFWRFVTGFTAIIIIDHLYKSGAFGALFTKGTPIKLGEFESTLRRSLFQVVSILTTTGFATKDIGSDFFGALSKQLFLAMMVIGGCVGSTSGGFKVLRIAILNRLIFRELLKLRISGSASTGVVIDKKIVPEDEVDRVASLFFIWMVLLLLGGGITAILSNLGPWESFSGMFSAVGNIGPCYISGPDMIKIHPVVKLTYIFGMLAGRLEILPVLLLFSRKAWR